VASAGLVRGEETPGEGAVTSRVQGLGLMELDVGLKGVGCRVLRLGV
jgi:hypothetical protein